MKVLLKNLPFAVLSGILLSLPWISAWFIPLFFFSFTPLILFEEAINNQKWHKTLIFIYSFFMFITWNLITCWWIATANPLTSVYFFENTFFMSLMMVFYHVLARHIRKNNLFATSGKLVTGLLFISLWLAFEYIHFNWDFSWPWITLGNGFAFAPILIQWYEYTGVLGGSLWVLGTGVIAADFILGNHYRIFSLKKTLILASVLLVPVLLSLLINSVYQEKGRNTEVVIVQPNIDPFEEKFPSGKKFIAYDKQLELFFQLAETKVTPQTRYVILPETAYPFRWELKDVEKLRNMDRFFKFRSAHRDLSLIIGLETFKRYDSERQASATTRYSKDMGYFDFYNSSIQINSVNEVPISHKSKHLHWAESIPLRKILNFIEPLTIYLGGFGSHGWQENRIIFHDKENNSVSTAICYESVFGEFVASSVRKGSQAIFVITNDGWWKDTPGHRQHLAYDRLRAIENRRYVARSSNNGISCIIDQKGNIKETAGFWTREAIRGEIRLNRQKTIYTLLGDYLGKLGLLISLGLTGYIVIKNFRNRKK